MPTAWLGSMAALISSCASVRKGRESQQSSGTTFVWDMMSVMKPTYQPHLEAYSFVLPQQQWYRTDYHTTT